MHEVVVVFGDTAVDRVEAGRITRAVLAATHSFRCASQVEAEAFRKGVEESCGWLTYALVTPEQLAPLRAAQQAAGVTPCRDIDALHAVVVFGQDEAASVEEDDFDADVARAARSFSFTSPAEKQAFLIGVEEANGWMDYIELDDDILAQARSAAQKWRMEFHRLGDECGDTRTATEANAAHTPIGPGL